jgi:hypothetical protein
METVVEYNDNIITQRLITRFLTNERKRIISNEREDKKGLNGLQEKLNINGH